MKIIKVKEAVIGSILAQPIYYNNGVLLYAEGSPVTLRMIKTLEFMGITEIRIKPLITADMDKYIIGEHMNRITMSAVRNKGADTIAIFSRELIEIIKSTKYGKLAEIIAVNDDTTYYHSVNVANLACTLGIILGLRKRDLDYLTAGALIHDIGKTLIPNEILNKPNKLTSAERSIMTDHPRLGYNLIKHSKEIPECIKKIVLQHHENFDGEGYPYGLHDVQIHRFARIVHICDVYEALCAERPYKHEMDRRNVRDIMKSNEFTMFDPYLLNKFLDNIPMYFIGEQVYNGLYYATVISNIDSLNPTVLLSDKEMDYEEFMQMRVNEF